ncbi:MAG TPA: anthranilate phosphoribosyltransferase, partial [Acidimicrobiales bacterium]|nr:anthranilate phosphoribosyltransferase [Acidimicrobiales bacterium]
MVGLSWPEILARLSRRESLSAPESEDALGAVLAGDATPAQVGAFLALLHAKGETAEEVTGLARAMVAAAVPCPLDPDDAVVVDLVGTGGDRLASINVTTLAAFITAGTGVRVCKHGNRAASSSVGTADVLEALGVAIEIGPVGVARCVREAGMGFCFAQRFHPAMRFVGPVRKELGVPTVFNFLGPLINPARTRYQLVGVSDEAMGPIMAGVFGATGSRHAMIVHADDGLDELSVTSPSTVVEMTG